MQWPAGGGECTGGVTAGGQPMVGVRGRQKGRMWLMAGEGAGKMQGIGKYELQDLDEKKTYLRKDARLLS